MQRLLSVFIIFFTASSVVNIYTYLMGISHVLASNQLINSDATLTVQANRTSVHIGPTLYGIMFEDISHAGDGGIYGELIQNHAFNNNTNTPVNWSLVTSSGAQGTMTLDNSHTVNFAPHSVTVSQLTAH
jgi:hypothetical protein